MIQIFILIVAIAIIITLAIDSRLRDANMHKEQHIGGGNAIDDIIAKELALRENKKDIPSAHILGDDIIPIMQYFFATPNAKHARMFCKIKHVGEEQKSTVLGSTQLNILEKNDLVLISAETFAKIKALGFVAIVPTRNEPDIKCAPLCEPEATTTEASKVIFDNYQAATAASKAMEAVIDNLPDKSIYLNNENTCDFRYSYGTGSAVSCIGVDISALIFARKSVLIDTRVIKFADIWRGRFVQAKIVIKLDPSELTAAREKFPKAEFIDDNIMILQQFTT